MFTKQVVEDLSKFLSIEFKHSDLLNTVDCIFSSDNSSYIDYNHETKQYHFLLFFDADTTFSFYTKSLTHKHIYEAMKNYNREIYMNEMIKVEMRKKVYHALKKRI